MNQSTPSPLTPENRFPDCVLMKLHTSPVEPEQLVPKPQQSSLILPLTAQAAVATTEEIHLNLTIRFYKQRIKVPGGEVEFGIRRGVLDLKLTNGKIPLEKMGLTALLELEVEVETQQEEGRTTGFNAAATGGIATAAIGGGVNATVTGGLSTQGSSKTTIKTKSKVHRVTNRGTEDNPVWEFSMEPHLSGQLTKELLGTVERNGQPCSVEATFAVRYQVDIHLFDYFAGVLSAKNLSSNKSALLTREVFLQIIAPKLQPYLSRVEGQL